MKVFVCYTIDNTHFKLLGDRLSASSIDKVFQEKPNAMEYIISKRNEGINAWFVELPVYDICFKSLGEDKKRMFIDVLEQTNYNYTKAAKELGVPKSTFHDWCKKNKITKKGKK